MKGKFNLRKKRKEYGKLYYTIKLNLTKKSYQRYKVEREQPNVNF